MKQEKIDLAKKIMSQTHLSKSDGRYLQTIYNQLTGSRLNYCMCRVEERILIKDFVKKYFDNEQQKP